MILQSHKHPPTPSSTRKNMLYDFACLIQKWYINLIFNHQPTYTTTNKNQQISPYLSLLTNRRHWTPPHLGHTTRTSRVRSHQCPRSHWRDATGRQVSWPRYRIWWEQVGGFTWCFKKCHFFKGRWPGNGMKDVEIGMRVCWMWIGCSAVILQSESTSKSN